MRSTTTPARWLVIAAFAAIYFIWGSSYIAIHFATETIPPFLMMGGRFIAAGLALFLLARRGGAALPTRRQMRNILLIGLLFVGNAGGILFGQVVLGVPSGITAVILATVPLWMVLLTWLTPGGKAPTWMIGIGLAVGFVGITLLSAPEAGGTPIPAAGVVVVLLAAAAWAGAAISSRHADMPASAPLTTGMQLLTGGAGLLLVSLLSGEWAVFDLSRVTLSSAAAMAYLGVFNSFIGFSAFVWLMRNVNPAHVATYAYVNPIVAVVLGALLAGEALSGRALFAGALILLSVFLISVSAERLHAWARALSAAMPRARPVADAGR